MSGPQNLSFVLKKPNEVALEDRPIPELINPHDVLVQVQSTGICGSDVHYWLHGRIGAFILTAPMVLGHESSGIIHSVGPSVTHLRPGDRVALEPGIPCRHCTPCKSGKYNLCPSMRFAATPPYNGTLTKYYVLPSDFCIPLPPHITLDEGALLEPLSVAVHIIKQSSLQPTQTILIFGAGPIGLLTCAVARAFGASQIISIDINPHRLSFSLSYAATGTFNPLTEGDTTSPQSTAQNLLRKFSLLLDSSGADIAIDASGAPSSIQTSIHALRPGGTFVQAGMGSPDIDFPIVAMCCKEITVKGSFRYGPGDYKLAADLLASGKVSVKELITAKVKFEEAERAFEMVKEGKGIKILIEGPE